MSALDVASDEVVNLSTALNPTAPMANTMRSESNKATGLAVADETMVEREGVCPPARGIDRANDLAVEDAAVPDRDMDSSVLPLLLGLLLGLGFVPG